MIQSLLHGNAAAMHFAFHRAAKTLGMALDPIFRGPLETIFDLALRKSKVTW